MAELTSVTCLAEKAGLHDFFLTEAVCQANFE